MTDTIRPRPCQCGHQRGRHLENEGLCMGRKPADRKRPCMCMIYRPQPAPDSTGRRCEARDIRHGVRCDRDATHWRAIRGQGALHARDLELCDSHARADGVFISTIAASATGCDTYPHDAAWFPNAALCPPATIPASVTA
jgi:hypothetical protein